MATNSRNRILDINPEALHQRAPLFIGSKREVTAAMAHIAAADNA